MTIRPFLLKILAEAYPSESDVTQVPRDIVNALAQPIHRLGFHAKHPRHSAWEFDEPDAQGLRAQWPTFPPVESAVARELLRSPESTLLLLHQIIRLLRAGMERDYLPKTMSIDRVDKVAAWIVSELAQPDKQPIPESARVTKTDPLTVNLVSGDIFGDSFFGPFEQDLYTEAEIKALNLDLGPIVCVVCFGEGCPLCAATGELSTDRCGICEGQGCDDCLETGVLHYGVCPACNGKGCRGCSSSGSITIEHGRVCPFCNGSGSLGPGRQYEGTGACPVCDPDSQWVKDHNLTIVEHGRIPVRAWALIDCTSRCPACENFPFVGCPSCDFLGIVVADEDSSDRQMWIPCPMCIDGDTGGHWGGMCPDCGDTWWSEWLMSGEDMGSGCECCNSGFIEDGPFARAIARSKYSSAGRFPDGTFRLISENDRPAVLHDRHGYAPTTDIRQIFDRSITTHLNFCDLHGSNLEGLDLSGFCLWQTNLDGANLRGVDFTDAHGEQATFRGADLTGSSIECAGNLKGANFTGAIGLTHTQRTALIERGCIVDPA